jgi:hypothetical protein
VADFGLAQVLAVAAKGMDGGNEVVVVVAAVGSLTCDR